MGGATSCNCEKLTKGTRETVSDVSPSASGARSPSEAPLLVEEVALTPRSEAEKFKEALKAVFASRKDAFQQLGGCDDDIIDEAEFKNSLRKYLGYTEKDEHLVLKLFLRLDKDGDGQISWKEFKDYLKEGEDPARGSPRGSISPKSLRAPKSPKGSSSPKASRRELGGDGTQKVARNGLDGPSSENGAGSRRVNQGSQAAAGEADFKSFVDFLKGQFKDPQDAFDGHDGESFDSLEFKQILEQIGYSQESSDSIFRFLDVAKEGRVTWQELRLQLKATWESASRRSQSPLKRSTTGNMKRRKASTVNGE